MLNQTLSRCGVYRYAVMGIVMLTWTSFSSAQEARAPHIVAPTQMRALMHKKLEQAKAILEGLALENYAQIERNARSLRLLSTEAGWKVIHTKEYTVQSEGFRRTCDSIEKAAKAEDVHRAALAYVSLTVRCVECHQYIRDNKLELTGYTKAP